MSQFDAHKILQFVSANPNDADSVILTIPVNEVVDTGYGGRVKITEINTWVYMDEDNENDGGDITFGYVKVSGNSDTLHDAIEHFYRNTPSVIVKSLEAAGFSSQAANEVQGSESGMQDEGLAHYDAGSVAEEVRMAWKTVKNLAI